MLDQEVTESADRTEHLKVVPLRRPWRWVSSAVLLVLCAMLAHLLVTDPAFDWHAVARFFTSQAILDGLVVTLELTVLAMLIGVALGIVIAVMRLAANPVSRLVASGYIWFFRGTPALVQLLFWYNLASLLPRLSLGIPFGPIFLSGAYMAEIVRAGILSVDHGQIEAAHSLGMTPGKTMRRIVLPQAMRVIVPPTGNETIGMLKYTSLASVISLTELLQSTTIIYDRNFLVIPLLVVASLWYLVATTVLSFGQYYLERYYARGGSRPLPPTPLERIRGWMAFGSDTANARGMRIIEPERGQHG